MDVFSRRIVGWFMSKHIQSTLVEDALLMALNHCRPGCQLLHHSDQGSQYAGQVPVPAGSAWHGV